MKNLNKLLRFSSLFLITTFLVGISLVPNMVGAAGSPNDPGAYAGADQTIYLPDSTTKLFGAGTAGVVSYSWTKISGSGTIVSPNSIETSITDLTLGTSVFRLTVANGGGATATDDVSVFVLAEPASVNAGPDQTLYTPASSTTLSGSSTGIQGFVVYYTWTKLSGSGDITSPSSAVTGITGLTPGTSVFRLTATNQTGTTASDDVSIFVLLNNPSPVNMPPVANAGPDKNITLPTSSVILTGSGYDPEGSIVTYTWTKISGSGTIASPYSASTNITGLAAGTSVFRLTVADDLGATGHDDMNVVVSTTGSGSGSGSSGGASGGMICTNGTTGIYPNCVSIQPNITLIHIPVEGVKKTSGLEAIKDLQRFLNWNLNSKIVPLVVDGKYGTKTSGAIWVYQKNNPPLKADTLFGPKSAAKAIILLKQAGMFK